MTRYVRQKKKKSPDRTNARNVRTSEKNKTQIQTVRRNGN